MTTPKVALYYTCKTPEGWKRFRAAIGGNHRIRARFAQVGKVQTFYEQGHYELRLMVDGKMTWRNVGEDASEAQAQQVLETNRAAARVMAADAGTTIVETSGRLNLRNKAEEFIDHQKAHNHVKGAALFKQAFFEFLGIVKVTYADELTARHIDRWYIELRKGGNGQRTIHGKHTVVFQLFRWLGINWQKLAAKAPTFTPKPVDSYQPEELGKFFASLTSEYHRVTFSLLLKAGLRKQEAMYLTWGDVDFRNNTLTVSEKDDLGFNVKDREPRTLPLDAKLAEMLKNWKEERGGRLVIGTSEGTPNQKLLPLLKRLAKKAKLNCGHCAGCVKTGRCDNWTLHKFRRTYCTMLLRSGLDPRTVMQFSGHSQLATIMRYLNPASAGETQARVNAIAWGD